MSDIKDKKKNVNVNEADYVETNSKQEKRNIKSIKSTNGIVYVILTFCVCLCLFGGFYEFYLKHLVIETTKTIKDVTITDTGIADAVEKVYDSVVTVKNYVRNQLYSTGSGFVFKVDNKYGYILTNYHVISGGNEVSVVFTNNKDEKATIVGYDEYSDIAVLAVDKSLVLATAQLGSSNDMRIGDTTFAVGTPVDSSVYSWSVTRGILSGKDRMVQVDNYVMSVLQTDTAINSGNSGGPLCNSNGEVIGITNMKLASSQIEGMGFAIPIEDAVKNAETIISGKKISRPYLGISIYDSNNYFNNTSGVYVESVEKNGAAYNAGIKSGDKILKVNGVEIANTSYFRYQLYKYNIGDKIKITIERNGIEKTLTVTLAGSGNKN
ncbi:MAG: trypsin-like peptidase domain-containing protein [Bacilli bacterium]|nr:trypsin-like peptidase domain-containing protein [Bacilli bacterium]